MNLADMISDYVDKNLREIAAKRDAQILEHLDLAADLGFGLVVETGPLKWEPAGHESFSVSQDVRFKLDRDAVPGSVRFIETEGIPA